MSNKGGRSEVRRGLHLTRKLHKLFRRMQLGKSSVSWSWSFSVHVLCTLSSSFDSALTYLQIKQAPSFSTQFTITLIYDPPVGIKMFIKATEASKCFPWVLRTTFHYSPNACLVCKIFHFVNHLRTSTSFLNTWNWSPPSHKIIIINYHSM
jgi:hypothetical protein